jgi:hypothetical protein
MGFCARGARSRRCGATTDGRPSNDSLQRQTTLVVLRTHRELVQQPRCARVAARAGEPRGRPLGGVGADGPVGVPREQRVDCLLDLDRRHRERRRRGVAVPRLGPQQKVERRARRLVPRLRRGAERWPCRAVIREKVQRKRDSHPTMASARHGHRESRSPPATTVLVGWSQ